MPKIRAATVAEHREAQTRALLDAAHALLAETGTRPGLAAVAKRAGLARSSVYQYFHSADDLLLAVVDSLLPRWESVIAVELSRAQTPSQRVMAYLWANLKLVADGEHAIANLLHGTAPEHLIAEKAMHIHRQLALPLVEALKELNVPDVGLASSLITNVLTWGSTQLESGRRLDEVWETASVVLADFSRVGVNDERGQVS